MQLAPGEKRIAEAPFGFGPLGGSAVLTTRRIIISGTESEESVPLAAITSVRAAFTRDPGAVFWGAVLLVSALGFGAGYRPLETAVNSLAMSLEKRMTEKAPEGEAYGRYLYVPTGAVWLLMLPLIGWGGYKLAGGAIGQTELTIATPSGELRRSARGRREELLEFGAATGRVAGG
jgi:hypothetical protein